MSERRVLVEYMERPMDALTLEELEEATALLREARHEAMLRHQDTLYRAADKALKSLREHRVERQQERRQRDREDGRTFV